jgi:hypothetical protein
MGHQQTSPDAPSHTTGVHRGEHQSGQSASGRNPALTTRKSRDATSVNPDKRAPIDPRMPNLPPA